MANIWNEKKSLAKCNAMNMIQFWIPVKYDKQIQRWHQYIIICAYKWTNDDGKSYKCVCVCVHTVYWWIIKCRSLLSKMKYSEIDFRWTSRTFALCSKMPIQMICAIEMLVNKIGMKKIRFLYIHSHSLK